MPSPTGIFTSTLSYVSRDSHHSSSSYSSHNNSSNNNNSNSKNRLATVTLSSSSSTTTTTSTNTVETTLATDTRTYDRATLLDRNHSDQLLSSSEMRQQDCTPTPPTQAANSNMASSGTCNSWPQPPKLPAPLQKPYMRVEGNDVIISPELQAHLRLLERDYTNYNHLAAFREALSLAAQAANLDSSGLSRSGNVSGTTSPMVASRRSSLGSGASTGTGAVGGCSSHSHPNDKTSGLEVPTSRRHRNSASSASGGVGATTNGALPSSTLRSRLRNLGRLRGRRSLHASLMGAVRPKRRSKQARTSSISYLLLRFPLFLAILCVVLLELLLYFLIRQIVNVWEYFFTWRGAKNKLRQQLTSANDYNAWKKSAIAFDRYLGLDAWKRDPLDSSYDGRLIHRQVHLLRDLCRQGEPSVPRLVDALLSGAMKSNLGGSENQRLYSRTYYGTKDILEDYVQQVTNSLEHVYQSNGLTMEEKIRFFKRASRSYGRTALCLSGGASFAYYHFGVIQALLDQHLLPKVVTGTSGGALIAAIICVRTDEELRPILTPKLAERINAFGDSWLTATKRFIQKRVLLEVNELAEKLQWVTLGSTTFREAFERTGRILNVTVVPYGGHGPPKLLNHVTAPNVIIWSALLASSAVPGLIQPVVLMMKNEAGDAEPFIHSGHTWRDGSLRVDIPIDALNHFFNVRYTIVSQVNPHVTLFFYEHRGSVGRPSSHLRGKGWRGGFVASSIEHALKLDLKKWVKIVSDLELLPRIMDEDLAFLWLQRFHGNVTIIPKAAIGDYPKLLSDPTFESMVHYMDGGRRRTWPKLHMIENRMLIEQKITACRRRLRRAQVNQVMSRANKNKKSDNGGIDHANNVNDGASNNGGAATPTPMEKKHAHRVSTLLNGVGSGSEIEVGQQSPEFSERQNDMMVEPEPLLMEDLPDSLSSEVIYTAPLSDDELDEEDKSTTGYESDESDESSNSRYFDNEHSY